MISDWIQTSTHTVVFTGAGMSTESGLPDFRSANQGLWQQKDPSRVASVQALNDNVEEFIDFYRKRVLGVKEYEPHAGHQILAEWEKRSRIHSIITQNVDGFHQQAGSHKVAELHGTLRKSIAKHAVCHTAAKIFWTGHIIAVVAAFCARPLCCSGKCCRKRHLKWHLLKQAGQSYSSFSVLRCPSPRPTSSRSSPKSMAQNWSSSIRKPHRLMAMQTWSSTTGKSGTSWMNGIDFKVLHHLRLKLKSFSRFFVWKPCRLYISKFDSRFRCTEANIGIMTE